MWCTPKQITKLEEQKGVASEEEEPILAFNQYRLSIKLLLDHSNWLLLKSNQMMNLVLNTCVQVSQIKTSAKGKSKSSSTV